MSGFRALPRKGHLERVKCIYSYLSKMRHAVIQICTNKPDSSELPSKEYDWRNIYKNAEFQLPNNAPPIQRI